MKDDTFYFSHDYNARNDIKIKKLIAKQGMTGYGIFWAIVEELYNNANALPTDYETLAFDIHADSEVVKSVVKDFGLFIFDGDTFGSLSVQRRLDERNEKSVKARKSANKRWERNANALQSDYEGNAIKESKRKEKKEELLHPLQKWIADKLPNVSKLKTQLSFEECERLIVAYPKKLIEETLLSMENKGNLTKAYKSVNLTIQSWCRMEIERHPEKAIFPVAPVPVTERPDPVKIFNLPPPLPPSNKSGQ